MSKETNWALLLFSGLLFRAPERVLRAAREPTRIVGIPTTLQSEAVAQSEAPEQAEPASAKSVGK